MSKDNKELKDWLKSAVAATGDKIEESDSFASIFTSNYKESPMCALQLGIAILLDKPLVIIADHKEKIPKHLTKIAGLIHRVDLNDPKSMQGAGLAIQEFTKQLDIEEEKSGRTPTDG